MLQPEKEGRCEVGTRVGDGMRWEGEEKDPVDSTIHLFHLPSQGMKVFLRVTHFRYFWIG